MIYQKTIKFFLAIFLVGNIFISEAQDADNNSWEGHSLYSIPNTLTKAEKKDGWKLLFDGKQIKYWRGYNMSKVPKCWIIEDNSLKINNGHL
jgi:hypothetical protein